MTLEYIFNYPYQRTSVINSYNDFNIITTILPDFSLNAHACLKPRGYDKNPLFYPPFMELSTDGYGDIYTSFDFFSSDYSWKISREYVHAGDDSWTQIHLECNYDEEEQSTPPIEGTTLEIVFPAGTWINCVDSEGRDVGHCSGNKWSITFGPDGYFDIPNNTTLYIDMDIDYFVFKQWNELDITKFYPEEVYGFYKNGDTNTCYVYKGQRLSDLKNDPNNTQWALVGEASSFFLENGFSKTKFCDISRIINDTSIKPKYDSTTKKMVYSSNVKIKSAEDVNKSLQGFGIPQTSNTNKWAIQNDFYDKMGFIPSYLDWTWRGPISVQTIPDLDNLTNTDEAWLIVQVGAYRLEQDITSSKKYLTYSLEQEPSSWKMYVNAHQWLKWKLSTSDIHYYLFQNPNNFTTSGVTNTSWLKDIFETQDAPLKCTNSPNSRRQESGDVDLRGKYYYSYTRTITDDDGTVPGPSNLEVTYSYDVLLTGFKGDSYYLDYSVNPGSDGLSNYWANLYIDGTDGISNYKVCSTQEDYTGKELFYDNGYINHFSPNNMILNCFRNKTLQGDCVQFASTDGQTMWVYSPWDSFILSFNQKRKINCDYWTASNTVRNTVPAQYFSAFPSNYGATSFNWGKKFTNPSEQNLPSLEIKSRSNLYDVMLDPWIRSNSGYSPATYVLNSNILSLLVTRKTNVPTTYYLYKIKWNHR